MAIIEFELQPGVEEEFEGWVATLTPDLETIEGFLGADPAKSLGHEGQLYEISYWNDATALERWSEHLRHGEAKAAGRDRLLKWYRIRVGEVERDWSVGPVPKD